MNLTYVSLVTNLTYVSLVTNLTYVSLVTNLTYISLVIMVPNFTTLCEALPLLTLTPP